MTSQPNQHSKPKIAVLLVAGLLATAFPIVVWTAWSKASASPGERAPAPPAPPSPEVHVDASVASPTPAAVTPLPRRAVHANCGTDFTARDGGAVIQDEPDSGLPGWQRPLVCATPDGGVIWTVEPAESRAEHIATMLARILATEEARSPARVRSELRAMDADSARGAEGWAVPGLLFRAPGRSIEKFVRIEGAAQNVRENGGNTTLDISLDVLGRERIEIVFPGIASDRVVNGAEVVVYGVVTGSSVVGGDQVVPEVTAIYVDPVPEGTTEQRARRMLRRTRMPY